MPNDVGDFTVSGLGAFGELPPPGDRPLTVAVRRGPIVESRHQVACVVVEPDGQTIAGWGDVDAAVYPRSAIKSLQALPLLESGAAERFGLSDSELALACSSHNGEAAHTDTVRRWLERIGLSVDALECGTHWPLHEGTSRRMFADGVRPTAAHNNCSGKHAGFLTTAVHLGEDHRGYIDAAHSVQRRVRDTLAEMCGVDLAAAPTGTDGCSIPTIAIPLRAIARGMARFAAPDGLTLTRADACRRLHRALRAAPFMVAGTGRYCTAAIEASEGRALVKTGAEGVFCAAIPERGVGVALKALDGTKRAAEIAISAVLDRLHLLDRPAIGRLAAVMGTPMVNWNGLTVGGMAVSESAAF